MGGFRLKVLGPVFAVQFAVQSSFIPGTDLSFCPRTQTLQRLLSRLWKSATSDGQAASHSAKSLLGLGAQRIWQSFSLNTLRKHVTPSLDVLFKLLPT